MSFLIRHCTLVIHKKPLSLFDDLLRSIVSQQLSTKAAATIYERFIHAFGSHPDWPYNILTCTTEDFRMYGLSHQKASYIKNVTNFFIEKSHFDTEWATWSDEDIIEELTKIKGVGKWTVEMILMFSLHREDVLPLDDLIIRNKMITLYQVTSQKRQQVEDLTAIAEGWRPYRSYACRYLWASKDMQITPIELDMQ